MDGLTPTEARLMSLLQDGLPHDQTDLRALLGDDMAVDSCLRVHLFHLRRKIRPRALDIATLCNGSTKYILVRTLPQGE